MPEIATRSQMNDTLSVADITHNDCLFFSFSYDPTVEIAFYFYFFRFIGHTNVPLAFSPDF